MNLIILICWGLIMANKWVVKTDNLKGFGYGDIIVLGKDGYARKEDGSGSYMIHHDNIKNAHDWFEEIKEKPDESKIITLYGACDEDGTSAIFTEKPEKNKRVDSFSGKMISVWENDGREFLCLEQRDLFSKDKPMEFKLVPMEEE